MEDFRHNYLPNDILILNESPREKRREQFVWDFKGFWLIKKGQTHIKFGNNFF